MMIINRARSVSRAVYGCRIYYYLRLVMSNNRLQNQKKISRTTQCRKFAAIKLDFGRECTRLRHPIWFSFYLEIKHHVYN